MAEGKKKKLKSPYFIFVSPKLGPFPQYKVLSPCFHNHVWPVSVMEALRGFDNAKIVVFAKARHAFSYILM